jgi:hypothetical protein
MARFYGTTEQRGLGAAHRADKERLLAMHHDGDPCWRCGEPMYKSQELDRGHIIDRALGGTDGPAALEHAACNRSAGARLGNQLQPRAIMVAAHDTICAVCGQPYHYAAKRCEICGVHYHPSGKAVRTCSRAHGVELRRRIYGNAGGQNAKPRPPCEHCGKPCSDGRRRYCSSACAAAARFPDTMGPHSAVQYYTCRYCGELGVTRAKGQIREVCLARECQLTRLAANNLIARKGMTREQADAAVTAYRAEGDHRQLRQTPGGRWRPTPRRRPVARSAGYTQDQLW